MFKTLSRLLLISALGAPLISSSHLFYPYISGKAIFFRVVVELSLCLLLIHLVVSEGAAKERKAIKQKLKNPLIISFGIFISLFVLTAFTGASPAHSWWSNFQRGEGVFQFIHYYLFFVLAAILFANRKRFEKLLLTQALVSIGVCLFGARQLMSSAVVELGGRIHANFGNPSYLAGYLLLTLPLLIYFLLQSKTLRIRIFWIFVIIFELYIFSWTQTRAAFLALIVGILLFLLISLFRSSSAKGRVYLIIALTASLTLGAIFLVTNQMALWQKVPILNRATNIEKVWDEFAPRVWTWGSALQSFKERPLLGWGAENFVAAFDRHYDVRHFVSDPARLKDPDGFNRQYIITSFDRAHNIFLEYLVAGGVVLFVAWLAIFFFYFKQLRGGGGDTWSLLLIIAPITYLIQGFFFFDVLPIMLPLMIFFAMAIVRRGGEWEAETSKSNPRSAWHGRRLFDVAVLAAFFLLVISKTAWAPLQKNLLMIEALQAAKPSTEFAAQVRVLKYNATVGQYEAINLLGKFELRLFEIAHQKGELQEIPAEQVRTLVDTYNEWFVRARKYMPDAEGVYINGAVNIEAGLAFGLEDYIERGKKQYEEVLTWAPNRLEFIQGLMRVASGTQDLVEYERYRTLAQSLRPDIAW